MENTAKNAELDQNLSLRLHKALTVTSEELYTLLAGQPKEVLLAILRNPALDEGHLLQLLKQRGLPEELFTTLYAAKRLLESSAVRFALAVHPETPSHISTTLISHLAIFELLKICLIPGVTPDHRLAAERTIIMRLSTQPLGNKITLARRGTATVVEALLKEGIPQVVEACLDNSHLKEGSVHQFLTGPTATAETISIVARNSRWKGRPNIRLAILKNPRTPAIWFTLFLPGMPHSIIKDLLATPRLTLAQKELIRQALGGKRLSA